MGNVSIQLLGNTSATAPTNEYALSRKEQCWLNNLLNNAPSHAAEKSIREDFIKKRQAASIARTTTNTDNTSEQNKVSSLLPEKLRHILRQDWLCVSVNMTTPDRPDLLILPSTEVEDYKPQLGSEPIKGETDDFEGFHRLTLSQGARLEESLEISSSNRKKLRIALATAYNTEVIDKKSTTIPDDAPLQPKKKKTKYHLGIQ